MTRWSSLSRLLTLVGLAAVPLAVLGVFFVLPVSGMLSEGFWVDGRFDPVAVAEVLTRPVSYTHLTLPTNREV